MKKEPVPGLVSTVGAAALEPPCAGAVGCSRVAGVLSCGARGRYESIAAKACCRCRASRGRPSGAVAVLRPAELARPAADPLGLGNTSR